MNVTLSFWTEEYWIGMMQEYHANVFKVERPNRTAERFKNDLLDFIRNWK